MALAALAAPDSNERLTSSSEGPDGQQARHPHHRGARQKVDTMTQPALVVDGMSILMNIAGPATQFKNGYCYSFLTQINAAVKKIKPKGVFVCWEGGYQARTDAHVGYKAHRSGIPDVIRTYREDVKRLLTTLGVWQLQAEGYEADDVGALLANTMPAVTLFSNDKDWLQLISPTVSLYQKVRGTGVKQERKIITWENFNQLTGWESPSQLFEAQLAMGDGVDGIPGIAGIGDPVIKAYHAGAAIPDTKRARLDEFYAGSEQYLLNKKLMDLRQIKTLPTLTTTEATLDQSALLALLNELAFASIVGKFDTWVVPWQEAQL